MRLASINFTTQKSKPINTNMASPPTIVRVSYLFLAAILLQSLFTHLFSIFRSESFWIRGRKRYGRAYPSKELGSTLCSGMTPSTSWKRYGKGRKRYDNVQQLERLHSTGSEGRGYFVHGFDDWSELVVGECHQMW